MYPLIFFIFAIAYASLRIWLSHTPMDQKKVFSTYLLAIIFFNIGCIGLLAFYTHLFIAGTVAKNIGWSGINPFQFEVAMANLAFGVLGVLCPLFRPLFWLATVIGNAIFLFGNAWVHFIQWQYGDKPFYHLGSWMWFGDILIPLIYSVLMAIFYFNYGEENT